MTSQSSAHAGQDNNIIETIQSLIVAFVLAMTFRGFVTEGFVIPTGSMAPTLLGQHALVHSNQTGYEFAVGLDSSTQAGHAMRIADPMLGEKFPGSGVVERSAGSGIPKVKRPNGMGDRILVLKSLYPFSQPKRYDVVVFKNPTDPVGEAANYIKRLIGLPNEKVWLTDGDVFARPYEKGDVESYSAYRIQRKPEHVQRAVWQTVYNSDFAPQNVQRLTGPNRYLGPPWVGDSLWDMSINGGRTYASSTVDRTALVWDQSRRAIIDWAPYNMLEYARRRIEFSAVNDVRISAGIVRAQQGLKTTLELEARSHLFQFVLQEGADRNATVTLRMRAVRPSDGNAEWVQTTGSVRLPPQGHVFNVEFWHVDQAMRLFIDGEPACDPLVYEWSPVQRLQNSTGVLNSSDVDALIKQPPIAAQIRWQFEGTPVTLHCVRLDRDLFYRHDELGGSQKNTPYLSGHAFGTHPASPSKYPGVLGPDQFMMCGDNSQMSLDSRLWGSPHPLVGTQIDDSPFTVNRKLLIGKAWVVYFPAPYPIYDGGNNVIPDFGRLRFIR